MLEGNTGTAKATTSNIRSIGSVQAQAWQHSTERTDCRRKSGSAEILKLDDFRPVPPPRPARRRDTRDLEKLHASITGVTETLATQSAACREFKAQVAELRMEIEDLGRNMDLYRAKLAGIDVSPVRRKALRLAAMMDPWTRS